LERRKEKTTSIKQKADLRRVCLHLSPEREGVGAVEVPVMMLERGTHSFILVAFIR